MYNNVVKGLFSRKITIVRGLLVIWSTFGHLNKIYSDCMESTSVEILKKKPVSGKKYNHYNISVSNC